MPPALVQSIASPPEALSLAPTTVLPSAETPPAPLCIGNSPPGRSPSPDRGWDSEWLYFSFVTMTTLGYGDILPVSAAARGLAYMQAIVGQFYIAILVAGLVSAYVSNRGEPDR